MYVPIPTTFLQDENRAYLEAAAVFGAADLEVQLYRDAPAGTPDANTDWSALTPADFTGSQTKIPSNVTMIFDPLTGYYYLRLAEPTGGWDWTPTNSGNLPQTIYAFSVENTALPGYLGGNLIAPVTLTAPGDIVSLGSLWIRLDSSLLGGGPP